MNEKTINTLCLILMFFLPVAFWVAVVWLVVEIPEPKYRYISSVINITTEYPVLWGSLLLGYVVSFGIVLLIKKGAGSDFEGEPYKKYYRGSRHAPANVLARMTRERNREQITIAGIPVPTESENNHALVVGATGTGKSVLLKEMACKAIMRGDRMIIVDPNGDMYSKFGKRGDYLLNPFDVRTEGWSFFNEIQNDYDFERFAKSLVPVGKTSDGEEWASYSRLLVRSIAEKLSKIDQADIKLLFEWATSKPAIELQNFLKGTDGNSLFGGEKEASKAVISTRFVVSKHLSQHIKMPNGMFSIREWLNDEDDKGNIYITWREDMNESIRSLISTWVDVICTSVLSLEEKRDRRIWLMIDELASMEKLPSLEDGLTKGRKNGLCIVAGLQSTSQLEDIYGRDGAQTIRACFKTLVVLGGARTDPKTNKDMSESLGDHEVERDRISRNKGRSGGSSETKDRTRERLVMPEEISNMKKLNAIIAFPEGLPITKTGIEVVKYPTVRKAFIEKEV